MGEQERIERAKKGALSAIQWNSLAWFEPERARIAEAISERLSIPISEFVDSEETAAFNFLTLSIAIGRWLYDSRLGERDRMEYGDESPTDALARAKAVAGILVRLVSHKFNQSLADVPRFDAFVQAFCKASGGLEKSTYLVLSAYSFVRQGALSLAWQIAGDGGDMSMDFFDDHFEALEEDEDNFMPRTAVVDACIQIYRTLSFVNGNPDFPASLSEVPEDPDDAHRFLRNYLLLGGMLRRPAMARGNSVVFGDALLSEALDSLGSDELPWVLLDDVFEVDGRLSIGIPIVPGFDDGLFVATTALIQDVPELAAGRISSTSFKVI